MKKYFAALLLAACPFLAMAADSMQLMTVQDLKGLAQRGKGGEVAATAYVQGAIEAYLNMDSVISNERKTPAMFCGFYPAYNKGIEHPAVLALPMISQWESQNMGMDKPAMLMVRSFLLARFGENCEKQTPR